MPKQKMNEFQQERLLKLVDKEDSASFQILTDLLNLNPKWNLNFIYEGENARYYGTTLLHLAAQKNNKNIISLLLLFGINPLIADKFGKKIGDYLTTPPEAPLVTGYEVEDDITSQDWEYWDKEEKNLLKGFYDADIEVVEFDKKKWVDPSTLPEASLITVDEVEEDITSQDWEPWDTDIEVGESPPPSQQRTPSLPEIEDPYTMLAGAFRFSL